jgi:alcohol dehydrogenase
MKQLTFMGRRTLQWLEVPEPVLHGPGEALVRPFVAARCDGDTFFLRHDFELALRAGAFAHAIDADFGRSRTNIFHGPFPYGHECVAQVISVGAEVRQYAPNDFVVVPWTISCGECDRCRAGFTSKCARGEGPLAAYGFGAAGDFGGMVSDLVRVPFADAMLVRVPQGVDPVSIASASDNMPDGYRAVGPHLVRMPGAPVLVIGGPAKSVGLYAAGIACAMGSSRVDYVDSDRGRLETAAKLGANPIQVGGMASWLGRLKPLRAAGYPITVDASCTGNGLSWALRATAPGGSCTGLGFYLRKKTPLPLWQMYIGSVTLHMGVCHARAHLPAVLDLVESRAFDPSVLTPIVADWDDAARAFTERATKVVVRRSPLPMATRAPIAVVGAA